MNRILIIDLESQRICEWNGEILFTKEIDFFESKAWDGRPGNPPSEVRGYVPGIPTWKIEGQSLNVTWRKLTKKERKALNLVGEPV